LFAQFDSLGSARFAELAERVGIPDIERFKACVAVVDSVNRINSYRTLALDSLHIKGTPTTIVNGKMYSFAPTIAELTKMISEAH
jgi:protein-disulfide isomerase